MLSSPSYFEKQITKMNSKTVTLRSLLSSKLLRYHLRRFFANFFGSDYIAVQTKFFIGNNDAPTQTLGKKFILNVKNRGEVNTYINYVLDEYNTKYVNKYTPEKVTQIRFVYLPVNQNDYALFLEKLNQEKSFTEDIGIGVTPF